MEKIRYKMYTTVNLFGISYMSEQSYNESLKRMTMVYYVK